MDGQSLTPDKVKQEQLKELFPEVFSEGKIDWEKLKATLGEDITFSNERYVLNWAGKSDAFKVLQAPTTKTLIPAKNESINFDETENIFIEGENLEVLKVLQKSYFGKIKMIYIDPPYNTGNDSFIYPDKFSETKEEYQKRVGDKDEEGYMTKDGMFRKNSKENGQYHSNWLNMMMPRLYLSKNLLRQDGFIFISIDDNEIHNLRLLMDEIFGEENFICCVARRRRKSQANLAQNISTIHEYVLIYSKSTTGLLNKISVDLDETKYKNPDNDPRGAFVTMPCTNKGGAKYSVTTPTGVIIEEEWRFKKDTYNKLVEENRLVFPRGGDGKPRYKIFLSEKKEHGVIPNSWWDNISSNQEATTELKSLFEDNNYFDFPKPIDLIKLIIELGSDDKSIILDFFAGSATTAHAVLSINQEKGSNRRFICIQLPELCEENSNAFNSGYKTISALSKERIRRAIKKIKEESNVEIKKIESEIKKLKGEIPTEETNIEIESLENKIECLKKQDLGFKSFTLSESNFKQWQQIVGKDEKAIEEQMKLFIDPVEENATLENIIYELILKSGKTLINSVEKKDNIYFINNIELLIIVDKVNQAIIDKSILCKPNKVIALDKLFKGNDQLKTNTVLQMKDAGIEFKTI